MPNFHLPFIPEYLLIAYYVPDTILLICPHRICNQGKVVSVPQEPRDMFSAASFLLSPCVSRTIFSLPIPEIHDWSGYWESRNGREILVSFNLQQVKHKHFQFSKNQQHCCHPYEANALLKSRDCFADFFSCF